MQLKVCTYLIKYNIDFYPYKMRKKITNIEWDITTHSTYIIAKYNQNAIELYMSHA